MSREVSGESPMHPHPARGRRPSSFVAGLIMGAVVTLLVVVGGVWLVAAGLIRPHPRSAGGGADVVAASKIASDYLTASGSPLGDNVVITTVYAGRFVIVDASSGSAAATSTTELVVDPVSGRVLGAEAVPHRTAP